MAIGLLSMGAGLLKGLTKKTGKKERSGKKMASAITKRSSDKPTAAIEKTQIKTITRTVPTQQLIPSAPELSGKSTGVDSVDGVLNKIDGTLLDLHKTLKDTSVLKKEQSTRQREELDKEKKSKREKMLEGLGSFASKMKSKVSAPFRGLWDILKTFFGNIIIGSLILFIIEQYEAIVKNIKKFYERIQEIWDKMEPIVMPILKFAKWLVLSAADWTAKLMGIDEWDVEGLKKVWGDIGGLVNGIKGAFQAAVDFKNKLFGAISKGKVGSPVVENETARADASRTALEKAESTKDLSAGDREALVQGTRLKDAGGSGSLNNVTNMFTDPLGLRNDPLGVKSFHEGGVVQESGLKNLLKGETVLKPGARENQIKSIGVDPLSFNFKSNLSVGMNNNLMEKSSSIKSSIGLDEQMFYEKGQSSTTTIIMPGDSPSEGGGDTSINDIYIPLLNTAAEINSKILQYQLRISG